MTLPTDCDVLTIERRTGNLDRLHDDGTVEDLGTVPRPVVRELLKLLPYAEAYVPLALEHGYPPALRLAATGTELPEDVAGPVLALVAYAPLRAAQRRRREATP